MLRFYNIFKLAFLCAFRLGSHGWCGFLGCFSVAIFCREKNNSVKSVTFFIFSSESRVDAEDADFGNMGCLAAYAVNYGCLLSELCLTLTFVIYRITYIILYNGE